MRTTVSILFLCFLSDCFGQTWQTIPEYGTYDRAPYGQFLINPYTNDIWINSEDQVSVIENDGDIVVFDNGELGSLYIGNNLQFAFTLQHVYYAHDYTALYTFDNYSPQAQFIFNSFQQTEFRGLTSNGDTVYIGFNTPFFSSDFYYRKHENGNTFSSGHPAKKVFAKNDQIYGSFDLDDDLYYFTGSNYTDYTYFIGNPFGSDDPEYLGGYYNDLKFSRYTDTLFIACDSGINLCYFYDIFDSITPDNTVSMPSAKVLEMEFDHVDNLWAVFGDANDVAFAIAKLEGNTWTNIIDASNSPINFSLYMGFEIDTLGNLWVIDEDALHTLIGPNSPGWLNTIEIKKEEFGVYPNPVRDFLHIKGLNDEVTGISIIDLCGNTVMKLDEFVDRIDVSTLSSGCYFIEMETYAGTSVLTWVKE